MLEYLLNVPPMIVESRLPGNIGDGISREAKRKKEKKTARINVPLNVIHPRTCFNSIKSRNI